MLEKVNEKIDVITIYKRMGSKIMPYKIRWNSRDYLIKKIGYHHKVRQGRNYFHIFSVSSDTLAFRLRFDAETMYWTLEEVSDGLTS